MLGINIKLLNMGIGLPYSGFIWIKLKKIIMRLYHALCLKEKEHIVLQFESEETCIRKLFKLGFDLGVKNKAISYSVVRADQNSTFERIKFSPSDIANS
jgi:hypothetical protein